MSAPIRPPRMSANIARSDSTAAATAGTPWVLTPAASASRLTPDFPIRPMSASTGFPGRVRANARSIRASRPSSPSVRRRFSDTREQSSWIAGPTASGCFAAAISRASNCRIRARVVGDGSVGMLESMGWRNLLQCTGRNLDSNKRHFPGREAPLAGFHHHRGARCDCLGSSLGVQREVVRLRTSRLNLGAILCHDAFTRSRHTLKTL